MSGDGYITRELVLGNTTNSGVQVFGGPIGVDVGEQVRWVDGVVSGASLWEIICNRIWGLLDETMPGELAVAENSKLKAYRSTHDHG